MTVPVTAGFVLYVLAAAQHAIAAGAPNLQSQPYALLAKQACDAVAADVLRDDLTPDTLRFVGMAIREAAQCITDCKQAIQILAWLARIEGRPSDLKSAFAEFEALGKTLAE